MTTTNTDAAREAAWEQFIHGERTSPKADFLRALDAFLAKAIEGADEKIKTAGDRWHTASLNPERYAAWVDAHAHEDMHTLLTLVTALSAKLAAQKAAHAKMLRDEASVFETGPEENDYFGDEVGERLRRLADKIEGGE